MRQDPLVGDRCLSDAEIFETAAVNGRCRYLGYNGIVYNARIAHADRRVAVVTYSVPRIGEVEATLEVSAWFRLRPQGWRPDLVSGYSRWM